MIPYALPHIHTNTPPRILKLTVAFASMQMHMETQTQISAHSRPLMDIHIRLYILLHPCSCLCTYAHTPVHTCSPALRTSCLLVHTQSIHTFRNGYNLTHTCDTRLCKLMDTQARGMFQCIFFGVDASVGGRCILKDRCSLDRVPAVPGQCPAPLLSCPCVTSWS